MNTTRNIYAKEIGALFFRIVKFQMTASYRRIASKKTNQNRICTSAAQAWLILAIDINFRKVMTRWLGAAFAKGGRFIGEQMKIVLGRAHMRDAHYSDDNRGGF